MKDGQRRELKAIYLRLPADLMKELKKAAIDEDLSLSEFIGEVFKFWRDNAR